MASEIDRERQNIQATILEESNDANPVSWNTLGYKKLYGHLLRSANGSIDFSSHDFGWNRLYYLKVDISNLDKKEYLRTRVSSKRPPVNGILYIDESLGKNSFVYFQEDFTGQIFRFKLIRCFLF